MAGKPGGGKSSGGKSGGGGGGKKETSDRVAGIASRGLRGEKLSGKDIKSLSGSVLSQDETKGPRGKK